MWPADAGPWKRFVGVLLGHRSPRRTFQRSLLPADAIAAMKRFGGIIVYNEARPERPIVEIDLSGPQWPNAVLLHVRQCKHLVRLNLTKTKITDSGLAHLGGLKELKELRLSHTRVSNAGLAYLRILPQAPNARFVEDEGHRRRPGAAWRLDAA